MNQALAKNTLLVGSIGFGLLRELLIIEKKSPDIL